MTHSIITPFRTRYGLTTHERMQEGRPIIFRREGGTKRDAVEHAQRAANALRKTVIIVERDEGMSDYYTRIQPEERR